MSSLSNALSRRIPLRGGLLRFLPKNLFWKEARQLLPLFWGLLALQIPAYLVLLFAGRRDGQGVSISLHSLLGLAAGVFAMLGALFFAVENEERTGPFLFRMPVSRRAIFWNKIAAALAIWIVLALASALLFLIVQSLWPQLRRLALPASSYATLRVWYRSGDPTGWPWYLSAGTFAFLCCARFSLRTSNALLAFLAGVGLVAAFQAAMLFTLMHPSIENYLAPITRSVHLTLYIVPVNLALCVVFGANLWRRFRDMEEPSGGAAEGAAALWTRLFIFRRSAATLKSIEFREKAFLWGILILAPIIHILIRPHLYVFFWLPFAGIVSGVMLWSRSECDGVGFFLHHQPISRRYLYRRRILNNLGFNAACLLVTVGLLSLVGVGLPLERLMYTDTSVLFPRGLASGRPTVWRILQALIRVSAPSSSGSSVGQFSEIWALVIGLPVAQFLGFYAGVLISPLRRGNVLGVIQAALVTFLIAAPTIAMWEFDLRGLAWATALIWCGLSLLSGWTNVRSRAMEPGLRKEWRIVGLGVAVVVWAALVNLVDPLDLLYLIGVDVYGWM